MAAKTKAQPDLEQIAERLHWRLFRMASLYRRRDHEQIEAGQLTLTQCSLLYILREHGAMRVGELAAFDGVTGPTATQAVRRLEGLGLVRRLRDPDDQRVYYIELTTAGLTMQRSASRQFVDAMVDGLSAKEIAALESALAPLERLGRAFEAPAVQVLPRTTTSR